MKANQFRAAIATVRTAFAIGAVSLAACAPAATSQTPLAVEESQQAPAMARMGYIVSFRPSHPLVEAQGLQNAGRYDEAERLVIATLRDNVALRGLCFERFTAGGAEIVLNVCAPDAFEDRSITQDRWLEQLGATMASPTWNATWSHIRAGGRRGAVMTEPRSVLHIVLRHGIWLDGKFFGDYRSQIQAVEAAEAAQHAMAGVGRIAVLVVEPEAFSA